MADPLQSRILSHLKSDHYRPTKPQGLARELELQDDEQYHAFRDALKELMHAGRVVLGAGGTVVLPGQSTNRDEFVGTYRQNRRGFGFVIPTDASSREDLFIPEGENGGALTGDIVKAKITNREHREGKVMYRGRITEVLQRSQNKFVGALAKRGTEWLVLPDGNTITEPILTPDAASRHIKVGTKVVVELTQFPAPGMPPIGVITDVLGRAGEKDVDLKSVIVQFNLPGDFPDEVKDGARQALDRFDPEAERAHRLDITDQIVCTIDPPDAKDYDDAISLRRLDTGHWELGVHIADVAHFVPEGSALDEEAKRRGNSCYFPGHVIPMLPEVLSNGVCSLQEGVPRLCKSAFITYDEDAKPVGTKFASTVIRSGKRLRYIEAQAIIDAVAATKGGPRHAKDAPPGEGAGDAPPAPPRNLVPLREGTRLYYDPDAVIPHPDGARRVSDYPPAVVELVHHMNALAKRLQKRRQAQGQINLDLPSLNLVLDEEGKVTGAVPEDTSFTHTLIEMFMVEANEAVARLFASLDVPYLRRTHPEPEADSAERMRQFVTVAGLKLPKVIDRKAIQHLLQSVKGKPEGFAINLAVLKSLTRAEYSPEPIGHYALASEAYGHFTSPIRRYADLTIHRLLTQYLERREPASRPGGRKRKRVVLEDIPTFDDLVDLGRHISFTERRAEDAERELRQVKILELLSQDLGAEYPGVVTGITNFGIFVQIRTYLTEGLIRYEDLMDDWWDVDARAGFIRGQRTGKRIGIGDVVTVAVVRVDVARRELVLAVTHVLGREGAPPRNGDAPGGGSQQQQHPRQKQDKGGGAAPSKKAGSRGGGPRGQSQPDRGGGPGRNRAGRGRGGGGGRRRR